MLLRTWPTAISLATLLLVIVPLAAPQPVRAATGCEEGYRLNKNGKCVPMKKATSCPPGTVPVPETDNCVKKATKPAGFEKEPWKKPGCAKWQKQCAQGNANACGKYESTCQVN